MSAYHNSNFMPEDIAFVRCLSPMSSLQGCYVKSRQTSVASLGVEDSASATTFQCGEELIPASTYESKSLRHGHLNFQLLTPATFDVAPLSTEDTWKRRLLKRTMSMFLPTRSSTPAPPPTRTPSLKSSIVLQTRTQSLFRLRTTRKRYNTDERGPVSFTTPWPSDHNEPSRRSSVRQSRSLAGLSNYFDNDGALEDLDPATLEALGVAQVQRI